MLNKYGPWFVLGFSGIVILISCYGAFVLPVQVRDGYENHTPINSNLILLSNFSSANGWYILIICTILIITSIIYICENDDKK